MLSPYEGKGTFTFYVPPKSERIVLGMRKRTYGTFWFNIESKYFICTGKVPSEANAEQINANFLQNYLQEDFAFSTNDDYYDYHSTSLETSKSIIKFQHIDINENNLEKMKKENPAIVEQLLKLEPLSNGLTFNKVNYDNGYYIGEFNSENHRFGRGAYFWSEGTYFVGYWEKGVKIKFGRYYYKNNNLFFEGEFNNGVKNGNGTQFYNDGSKYKGNFTNDKRHGHGTFLWPDGSSWEGPFVNGQFHGVGKYAAGPGEEAFEVQYDNGRLVE